MRNCLISALALATFWIASTLCTNAYADTTDGTIIDIPMSAPAARTISAELVSVSEGYDALAALCEAGDDCNSDRSASAHFVMPKSEVFSPINDERIGDLAGSLGYDPVAFYRFVHDQVVTTPMFGLQGGALKAATDYSGTPLDQAELLAELLEAADVATGSTYSPKIVMGSVRMSLADAEAWLGVSGPDNISNLLAEGGIPADVSGSTITLIHFWVRANLGPSGAAMDIDPSFKRSSLGGRGIDDSDVQSAISFGDLYASAFGSGASDDDVTSVTTFDIQNLENSLQGVALGLENALAQSHKQTSMNHLVGRPIVDALDPELSGYPNDALMSSTAGISSAGGAVRVFNDGVPDFLRTKLSYQCAYSETETISEAAVFSDDVYGIMFIPVCQGIPGVVQTALFGVAVDHPYPASENQYGDQTVSFVAGKSDYFSIDQGHVSYAQARQMRAEQGRRSVSTRFIAEPSIQFDTGGYDIEHGRKNWPAAKEIAAQFSDYLELAGDLTDRRYLNHITVVGITSKIGGSTYQATPTDAQVRDPAFSNDTPSVVRSNDRTVEFDAFVSVSAPSVRSRDAVDNVAAQALTIAGLGYAESAAPRQENDLTVSHDTLSIFSRRQFVKDRGANLNEIADDVYTEEQNKFVLITQENWAGLKSNWSNEVDGVELNRRELSYIESYLAFGYNLVVPEDWYVAPRALSVEVPTGLSDPEFVTHHRAYGVASTPMFAFLPDFNSGGIVVNGRKGGVSLPSSASTGASVPLPEAPKYSTKNSTFESVNVDGKSGALTYTPPADVSDGVGSFPHKLTFQRTYNSKNYENIGMGHGWSHNWQNTLSIANDGLFVFGHGQGRTASPAITAIEAIKATITDRGGSDPSATMKRAILLAGVNEWLATQTMGNVATVAVAGGQEVYFKSASADGKTWLPLSVMEGELTQSGDIQSSFIYRRRYDEMSFVHKSLSGEVHTFEHKNLNIPDSRIVDERWISSQNTPVFYLTNWKFPGSPADRVEIDIVNAISRTAGLVYPAEISNNLGASLSIGFAPESAEGTPYCNGQDIAFTDASSTNFAVSSAGGQNAYFKTTPMVGMYHYFNATTEENALELANLSAHLAGLRDAADIGNFIRSYEHSWTENSDDGTSTFRTGIRTEIDWVGLNQAEQAAAVVEQAIERLRLVTQLTAPPDDPYATSRTEESDRQLLQRICYETGGSHQFYQTPKRMPSRMESATANGQTWNYNYALDYSGVGLLDLNELSDLGFDVTDSEVILDVASRYTQSPIGLMGPPDNIVRLEMTELFAPSDDENPMLTVTYDGSKKVRAVTTRLGHSYTYGSNESSSFTKSPLGNVSRQFYDSLGRGIGAEAPDGAVSKAEYDALNRLVKSIAPEGNYTTTAYDDLNRIEAEVAYPKPAANDNDPVVAALSVAYGYADNCNTLTSTASAYCGQPTSYTDARQNVTEFRYYDAGVNGAGQIKEIETPDGALEKAKYNSYGQLVRVENGEGEVSEIDYHDVSYTDASGTTVKTAKSVPRAFIADPDGVASETTVTFDKMGNLKTVDGPLSVPDIPENDLTTYRYDDYGRLDQIKAPHGSISEYHYTDDGLLDYERQAKIIFSTEAEQLDPANWIMTDYDYYLDGQIKKIIDPLGEESFFFYDADGRAEFQTDAEGRTTRTVYDAAGRVEKLIKAWTNGEGCTDPLDAESLQQCYQQYTYTENGQPRTVTDANGNVTTYAYDRHDRLKTTEMPDGSTHETTSFDANGNALQVKNRAGQTITATYDVMNRVKTRTVPSIDGSELSYAFGYDKAGRILMDSVGDGSSATSGQVGTLIQRYKYDDLGRLQTKWHHKPTESGAGFLPVTYVYDIAGRVESITHPDGFIAHFDYDALDRPTAVKGTDASAACTDQAACNPASPELYLSQTYDALSRPDVFTAANGVQLGHDFSVRGELEKLDWSFTNGIGIEFDFLHNKVGQIRNRNVIYTSGGSAITPPEPLVWTPVAANFTGAEYGDANELNQLTRVNGNTLGYDQNGNLTRDARGWSFAYSAENQLRRVQDGSDNTVADYHYYADGTRALRDVGGAGLASVYHFYAGDQEVMEARASDQVGGALLPRDGPLQTLRRFIRIPGSVDQVSLTIDYTGAGCDAGCKTWSHTDHQGSLIATSDEDGEVSSGGLDLFSYSPYGAVADGQEDGMPFRFTGQRLDPETGLYYYKARYYSSDLGRFLQVDPIGYQDQQNLYGYVGNDPLNRTDPTGMQDMFPDWFGVEDAVNRAERLHGEAIEASASANTMGDGIAANRASQEAALAYVEVMFRAQADAYVEGIPLIATSTPGGRAAGMGVKAVVSTPRVARAGGWMMRLGRGCGCFVAGTLVMTDEGLTPVEEISVGDLVLSRSDETGEQAFKPVTDLVRPPLRSIWMVELAPVDGEIEIVRVTDDHPWWVSGSGWVRTDELIPGLSIGSADGLGLKVLSVTETDQMAQTYNFTVADFHTYFVTDEGAWVHNTGPCFNTATKRAIEGLGILPDQVLIKNGVATLPTPQVPLLGARFRSSLSAAEKGLAEAGVSRVTFRAQYVSGEMSPHLSKAAESGRKLFGYSVRETSENTWQLSKNID